MDEFLGLNLVYIWRLPDGLTLGHDTPSSPCDSRINGLPDPLGQPNA